MADQSAEERTYEQLKEILIQNGWKEQTGGEGNMNGELGTNFMRNDQMIGISFNDCPDEETLDELFGSEDDMAPSIVTITNPKFCDSDGDAINEPEDD